MFYFIHTCLTKKFIKLGVVLSCGMAFNIIFFHNCIRILSDEANNTLLMWENKIFRAPFSVENSSFTINFSFLGCRHFFITEIITEITIYSYEISKIKSDAVNKESGSILLYCSVLRNKIVNSGVVLLHKLLL